MDIRLPPSRVWTIPPRDEIESSEMRRGLTWIVFLRSQAAIRLACNFLSRPQGLLGLLYVLSYGRHRVGQASALWWKHHVRRCDAREAKNVRPQVPWGVVRIVRDTVKMFCRFEDDLGVNHQMLGNGVAKDEIARGERLDSRHVDAERVKQLEREIEKVKVERDVLKRSVLLW